MARDAKSRSDAEDSDGPVGLLEAWDSSRNPFNVYVSRLGAALQTSRLSVSAAAVVLDTQPIELMALKQLASLPDEMLALLDGPPPPKTTWLHLASAGSIEAMKAGLKALAKTGVTSPAHAVKEAIKRFEGPSAEEKVMRIQVSTLWAMWKKAKAYNALGNKGQRALADLTGKIGKGFPMSPPQIAFLKGLLEQLAQEKVIRRDSPDGDQEVCNEVLDALGR